MQIIGQKTFVNVCKRLSFLKRINIKFWQNNEILEPF